MFWKSKKKKEEEAQAKAVAEAAAKAAFEQAAPPPPPKTPYDMLLVALRNKNLERVEEAIAKGADVTANGNEPLVTAADHGWGRDETVFKMARALVLAGADINGALKTARDKQEEVVGPGYDGYGATILDGEQYDRYEYIGKWLREKKGDLLEEYIAAKFKPLEQERDELKRQVTELKEAGGAAKPDAPGLK